MYGGIIGDWNLDIVYFLLLGAWNFLKERAYSSSVFLECRNAQTMR